MDITRDRVGEAWLRFTGSKTAQVPRAAGEIIPVMLVDNLSRGGPYPVSRNWMAGNGLPALAANYVWFFITNTDPQSKDRSRVIIDRVIARINGLSGMVMFSLDGALGTGSTPVDEISGGDNRQTPPTFSRRVLPNVGFDTGYSGGGGSALNGFPLGGTNIPSEVRDLGIELGPGMTCAFRGNGQNADMWLFAQGRYYESV